MRLLAQTIIMRSTCENKVFLLLSVSQSHLALPPISTCTLAHPPVSSAWSVLSSPLGHARAHVAYPSAQPREAPDDSPRAGAFAAPPAERNAPAGAALTRRQSARRCVCRTAGRAQRPCGCSVNPPSVRAPVRLPHRRPSATPLRVQRCAPPLKPSLPSY